MVDEDGFALPSEVCKKVKATMKREKRLWYEDSVLNQGNASFGGWTWEQDVLYPFGYGLSYTTFTQELQGVSFDDTAHTAALQVKVTNTGAVAGKEVVQVYGQSPYTEYDKEHLIEKAAVQLMGFEKTAELAPGASETVTVQVPMQWLASFDTVMDVFMREMHLEPVEIVWNGQEIHIVGDPWEGTMVLSPKSYYTE